MTKQSWGIGWFWGGAAVASAFVGTACGDEFSGGRSITEWRPPLQVLIDRGDLTPAFPQNPPWHFRIYRIGNSLLAPPK